MNEEVPSSAEENSLFSLDYHDSDNMQPAQIVRKTLDELQLDVFLNDYDPAGLVIINTANGKPAAHEGNLIDERTLVDILRNELSRGKVRLSRELCKTGINLCTFGRRKNAVLEALEALPAPADNKGIDYYCRELAEIMQADDGKDGIEVTAAGLKCCFLQSAFAPRNGSPEADNVIIPLDYCPILQGPPRTGKSQFGIVIESALRLPEGRFCGEVSALPKGEQDKDKICDLLCYWWAEIPELNFQSSKLESDQNKREISRRTYRYRPPYGETYSIYPVRCTKYGTTNEDKPFIETEANGRYLLMYVGKVLNPDSDNYGDRVKFRDKLASPEGQELIRNIYWCANDAVKKYAEDHGWQNIKSCWQLSEHYENKFVERVQGATAIRWYDELKDELTEGSKHYKELILEGFLPCPEAGIEAESGESVKLTVKHKPKTIKQITESNSSPNLSIVSSEIISPSLNQSIII